MSKAILRWALALTALAAYAPAVQAVGTAAGTDINNVAQATYDDPEGNPRTVNSNTATLRVDELLDVTVVLNDAGNVTVAAGDTDQVLSFTITNTGNGPERYALTFNAALAGDDFDPTGVQIWLDNGDGIFDPLTDTLYSPSGIPTVPGNEPLLAQDNSLTVFVVGDIPAAAVNGDLGLVRLTAEALTAQATDIVDAAGFVFAGSGPNGSDSVVGSSQAYASGQNGYFIASVLTSFSKSQTILDPFGGNNPVPGAIITYTLVFNVAGSGDITNLLIVDQIPASTTYVPDSMTLNGVDVTDIADGDVALFNSTVTPRRIQLDLGTVSAPTTHTVVFQVQID